MKLRALKIISFCIKQTLQSISTYSDIETFSGNLLNVDLRSFFYLSTTRLKTTRWSEQFHSLKSQQIISNQIFSWIKLRFIIAMKYYHFFNVTQFLFLATEFLTLVSNGRTKTRWLWRWKVNIIKSFNRIKALITWRTLLIKFSILKHWYVVSLICKAFFIKYKS